MLKHFRRSVAELTKRNLDDYAQRIAPRTAAMGCSVFILGATFMLSRDTEQAMANGVFAYIAAQLGAAGFSVVQDAFTRSLGIRRMRLEDSRDPGLRMAGKAASIMAAVFGTWAAFSVLHLAEQEYTKIFSSVSSEVVYPQRSTKKPTVFGREALARRLHLEEHAKIQPSPLTL